VALVGEDKALAAIKVKDGVSMLWQRRFRWQVKKPARHAQVRNQHKLRREMR
jgi:hypothetical protein